MTSITTPLVPKPQIIDGSYLEGGGQILRTAFAYSALLKKPISVEKIRGGRSPSGLKRQHATGIELVSRISVGSTLTGVKPKSTEVIFEPGTITSGTYVADPGTAASITMLLQVSLPCLLFPSDNSLDALSTSELTLRGGTNATHAPPIDQVIQVLFPFLIKHFDIHPTLTVHRRGFYPRGQGEVSVSIPATTKPLPAVVLRDRDKVTRISGRAYVAGALPAHLPQAMVTTAQEKLIQAGYDKGIINIDQIHDPVDKAFGNGSGIVLWAATEDGCVLSGGSIGDTGKRADAVGKEAADELIANLAHGGCVDEYLQDQIIIFMALAQGKSTVVCGPLSRDTRVAIWMAETMTDAKFTITESENKTVTIQCSGIAFSPAR